MKRWHIRSHGHFEQPAADTRASLADILGQAMAHPPRRINRYTQLALIGAHRAVAKLSRPLAPQTPLYLASENGGIAETVSLMDGILFERLPPKPMAFVNLPSNMAGFYTGASLQLRGHNMTVSRHFGAFGAMLELAELDTQREHAMLLGLVCEAAWPLSEHRYRRGLPAGTPLLESSYWLVVGAHAEQPAAALDYGTTRDLLTAREWLADGDYWAIDPQLPHSKRRALTADLPAVRAWPHIDDHRGHPDAIISALFAGLEAQPQPRLHLVARNAGHGFQLLGLVAGPGASASPRDGC